VSNSHVVAIVLEAHFGERLYDLASRIPVWIVDTSTNRAAAQRYRDLNREQPDHEVVTTFKVDPTQSPETWLTEILGTVDLHHGEYSQHPAYTAIEVFGAGLTSKLREAFAEFGVNTFVQRSGGFVGTKSSDLLRKR
jgi:hypothetical protein